jgi:uncharacterized protein
VTNWNKDLVLYRLERAHETLEDARILAGKGRWNACVNRLYYACAFTPSPLFLYVKVLPLLNMRVFAASSIGSM